MERQSPVRLFYQLVFEHEVAPGTKLVSGNYTQPFDAVFQLVCERTGAHVPEGDIYANGIEFPACIQNHRVFGQVLDYFRHSVRPRTGQSQQIIAAE